MPELRLYGTVGEDWWDGPCFDASSVAAELADMDGDLTVHLNSGGGSVHDGTSIYNQLAAYPGAVTIVIEGIAASIASIIAMAGDTIIMGAAAMIMVHDPAQWFIDGRGTEEEHLRVAKGLRVAANAMGKIYARQTGLALDEVRAIMREETWLDGEAALAQGFVTSIADEDDAADAAEAAQFPYQSYANAPPHLAARQVAERQAPAQFKPAMVAMLAGQSAPKRRPLMANDTQEMTHEAEAEEDQEMEAQDEELDAEDDEEDMPSAEGDDAEEEDGEGAPLSASALLRMTASFDLPAAAAQHMINRRMTAPQASDYLAAQVQGDNPMTRTTRRGPARATIQRDERETRREGMTAALVAQMARQRDVDGNARRFMDMSLVQIAADACGFDGELRSATGKINAFQAAAHATSDFPAIFENAINKRLLDTYALAQPTFTQIAEEITFTDFREIPLVRPGDFPELQKVNENGEIKHGTFGESRETAILSAYGVAITISRKMMINDDLGAIDRVISNYGQRVATWEDKTFYVFALTAKLANNKTVFHADHGNLAASGAAISEATVDAGFQAMDAQKSIDGERMGLVPSILLTGAKQRVAAQKLITATTPANTDDVNVFAGDLTHVQTARITDGAWYLLTAPGAGQGAQWVYGYLDGATGPRTRIDEPFGQQGMAFSVEHDFGVGAQDFRMGYKNPGAS